MRRATVIVPWADDGQPERAAALAFVLGRWRHAHPRWPLVVTESSAEPWVKAAAVMPAVMAARPGPLIVADADVWCDDVTVAVAALGEAAWAVPHRYVRRLNAEATAAVYGGASFEALGADSLAERAYIGMPGGGLVVADRDALVSVPFDPRFVGWGGEDCAIGLALHTLAGEAWLGTAPLWHLWHAPQLRPERRYGNAANEALRLRYRRAMGNRAEMATLIDEAREASTWQEQRSRLEKRALARY